MISHEFRAASVPRQSRTFHRRGSALHLLEAGEKTYNYIFALSKDSLAQFKKKNQRIFQRASNILTRSRQNQSK